MREKSKKLAGAKGRLIDYLDSERITKAAFYKATSLGNGFLDKNENIGSNNVETIISTYPNLNLEWLITGKGEMKVEKSGGCAFTEKILEKISDHFQTLGSSIEKVVEQNGEVIKQHYEIVRINSEVVKQNAEVVKMHSEAMQMNQTLIERIK